MHTASNRWGVAFFGAGPLFRAVRNEAIKFHIRQWLPVAPLFAPKAAVTGVAKRGHAHSAVASAACFGRRAIL